jgi:hypothetical protein
MRLRFDSYAPVGAYLSVGTLVIAAGNLCRTKTRFTLALAIAAFRLQITSLVESMLQMRLRFIPGPPRAGALLVPMQRLQL